MADLKTRFMGLELSNPFIVGSCGLTAKVDGIVKCAQAGAGAVVVKSIFEEAIAHEVEKELSAGEESLWHPEALDYVKQYSHENEVGAYLKLVSEAKAKTDIPVIASVHCVSADVWPGFAKRVQDAGADAVELNAFVLPSNLTQDSEALEGTYFEIARAVKEQVSIPVSLKLGPYFTSMASTLVALSKTGISGLTLFNRFYSFDIDPEKMQISKASFISEPGEYVLPMRWLALLHGRVGCDMAATTGVHDAASAAKLLLAGGERGAGGLGPVQERGRPPDGDDPRLRGVDGSGGLAAMSDVVGRMSHEGSQNPAAYERVQFMKFSTGLE